MSTLKEAGVEGLRTRGEDRGIPEKFPLDLVSAERERHQSSRRYKRHLWTRPVPPGALSQIGPDEYIFTPVYCLMQVAAGVAKSYKGQVDERFYVVIVAQLGCELCGQYSVVDCPDGFVFRVPLASTGEISVAIDTMKGLRGLGNLKRAFPWIIDNTRSPKETDLFLLLCLPPELGGFGLPRPLSNFDLDVSSVTYGFFARWNTCNVDFFWPQAKLVVEYDSQQFHEGDEKVKRDRLRAEALEKLGYTVVTITHDDLYSVHRLRDKACEIADALGAELPPVTIDFIEVNNILRTMLLRHDPWV